MAVEEYPFPGSAGRGVRVAVIDSGVNTSHPHILPVAGGVSIGAEPDDRESYIDVLGHGTAVMAAIQEKASEAEYFAVKLFHTTLSAKAPSLIEAIEWCIEHGMDVVNLSLGTPNPHYTQTFTTLVEQAAGRGMVLVSARETNGQIYLPGSLPSV